ncbi:MAG: DNA translocase FtsK 4TM domain-containing protein [Andreesenia angusta]|nr:DNA translocase FtsK 4TM domain-containing protein [Andreesenia angusta]
MSKSRTKVKSRNKKKTKKKNNLSVKYLIISFFIAFIMMLSLYIESEGIILKYLKDLLQILFGMGAFLLPISIFAFILLYYYDKGNYKRNLIASIFIFISVLVILDASVLTEANRNMNLTDKLNLMKEIGQTGFGGGLLGGIISHFLVKLFGFKPTIITMGLIIIVSGIVITNRSFIELIKSLVEAISKIPPLISRFFTLLKGIIKDIFKSIEIKTQIRRVERERKLKAIKEESRKKKKKPVLNTSEDIPFEVIRHDEVKKTNNYELIIEDENSSGQMKIVSENEKKDKDRSEGNIKNIKYERPPIDILSDQIDLKVDDQKSLIKSAEKLIETLSNFGIKAKIDTVSIGPSITKYEIQIAPGIKVSRILNLSNDLALSLAAPDVRIEAPIPGKSAIGIEVPNKNRTSVRIREIIESDKFKRFKGDLPIALGKNVEGKPIVVDIEKMPHLLIAGATGSGKSVCINTIITSIVYKSSPDDVKLILIDPKVVELSIYNGIPHLYIPVVTNPDKAAGALNWAVNEMSIRYELFANQGVRDIIGYNKKREQEKLPRIVMIIDELSDLMMTSSSKEVEEQICRIAQMARAAGIHLIIATQRPSVDVITGTIKANIPSRISFATSSQMDSRTILDMGGAEKLLGRGDMLFYPQEASKPRRIQGAYIDDEEVEELVEYLKSDNEVVYEDSIIEDIERDFEYSQDDCDELLSDAIELVINEQQASTSFLQRRLKIGYARAARIIDQMEERRVVGPLERGNRGRKVLISREEFTDDF